MKQHSAYALLLVVFVLGLSSRFFLTGPLLLDPLGESERLLKSSTIEKIIKCSQGLVLSLDDPTVENENIAKDTPLALAMYLLIKAETDSVTMPASVVEAESAWFSGDTVWSPPQPRTEDKTAFVRIRGDSKEDQGCLADKYSVRIR